MAKDRQPAQIARDRRNIGRMYLKGMIQVDIARELKLSQPTVSNEIKLLVEEWKKEYTHDINEAKQRELAKLDNLELEYWEAWVRSQKDAIIETTGTGQKGGVYEFTKTETQVGDARFLDGVLKCIDKRCAILGVEAPKKIAPTDPSGENPYMNLSAEELIAIAQKVANARNLPDD